MARQYALDPALIELLYQSLETAQSGIKVYTQALACALNKDLGAEWRSYLEQLRRHEQVLLSIFIATRLEPLIRTPGRDAVTCIGDALIATMRQAQQTATRKQAEVVASECIVLVEIKDQANWALLAHIAKYVEEPLKELLSRAVDSVEDEVDRRLMHTQGWMRELWMQALGYAALLPPPDGLGGIALDMARHAPDSRSHDGFARHGHPEERLGVA